MDFGVLTLPIVGETTAERLICEGDMERRSPGYRYRNSVKIELIRLTPLLSDRVLFIAEAASHDKLEE